jgi:hypothetical protein
MAQTQRSRAGDPAAEAVFSGKEFAAENTQPHRALQVLDDLGHRLLATRSAIVGQPRLASPRVWRMARDRWFEDAP